MTQTVAADLHVSQTSSTDQDARATDPTTNS
jgi:hypothetical protein